MLKKKISLSNFLISTLLCGVLFPLTTQAQFFPTTPPATSSSPTTPTSTLTQCINNVLGNEPVMVNAEASVSSLLGGYGVPMAAQYILCSPSYDLGNLQSGGAAYETMAFIPYAQATPWVALSTQNTLTSTNTATSNTIKNVVNQITTAPFAPLQPLSAATLSGLSPAQVGPATTANGLKQVVTQLPLYSSFSLNSLTGSLAYSDHGVAAQNFITLVSGLGNPMPVVDFSKVTAATLPNIKANPTINNYLAKIWNYTAQQAAGLNAFYQAYAERLPSSNQALANAVVLPPGSSLNGLPANPSPLQVEHFLATRRIEDPNWYVNMSTASPIEVQRQTLYLLAEIRAEMFKQSEETKNTNRLLSLLILQNVNNSRMQLSMPQQQNTQAPSDVQKAVDGITSGNPVTTPTSNTNIYKSGGASGSSSGQTTTQ